MWFVLIYTQGDYSGECITYLVWITFQGRNLSNFFGGNLENWWFHKYIPTPSDLYLPRLVNVVSECPLTFTGVKFGTKEPKTPVLPYTLEHVLFLFKNRIINLLQTFRKIRSDFWKNMYEYVQKLRQFCTTIIAEDCTMDDFGKYCQRNIEEFVLEEL